MSWTIDGLVNNVSIGKNEHSICIPPISTNPVWYIGTDGLYIGAVEDDKLLNELKLLILLDDEILLNELDELKLLDELILLNELDEDIELNELNELDELKLLDDEILLKEL